MFGPVAVHRIAYRGDYVHDLHLLDASLNLPEVKASHGLARLAVLEAVRGSFAAATEQLRTGCGVKIGSRQVQDPPEGAPLQLPSRGPSGRPSAGNARVASLMWRNCRSRSSP